MATHLSESSVNSLLRLINQADTSASYNEKVDLLKKSGILAGDNRYSNVANGFGGTTNTTDAGYDETHRRTVVRVFDIVKYVLEGAALGEIPTITEEINDILLGKQKNKVLGYEADQILRNRQTITKLMMAAYLLDMANPGGSYTDAVAAAIANGLSGEMLYLMGAEADTTVGVATQNGIRDLLANFKSSGFNPAEIAYSTSNKLNSFFTDGLYNFTYITYPTKTLVNGISGTGRGLISSYKDIYTNRVVKKELDQTTTPSSTLKLQSFDIMTKYITMATNGSSSVGKFRFISDTLCNVMYYGYSSLFGKFYTCKTVIQKTPLGFAIKSSIVNLDHSTTLYYAALYTRVSLPLDKIKRRLAALPIDVFGNVSVSDALKAIVDVLNGGAGADFLMTQLREKIAATTISPEDLKKVVLEVTGGTQ
jgi:hypothetical protein